MIRWQSLRWLIDFLHLWNPKIHFQVQKNLSRNPTEFSVQLHKLFLQDEFGFP